MGRFLPVRRLRARLRVERRPFTPDRRRHARCREPMRRRRAELSGQPMRGRPLHAGPARRCERGSLRGRRHARLLGERARDPSHPEVRRARRGRCPEPGGFSARYERTATRSTFAWTLFPTSSIGCRSRSVRARSARSIRRSRWGRRSAWPSRGLTRTSPMRLASSLSPSRAARAWCSAKVAWRARSAATTRASTTTRRPRRLGSSFSTASPNRRSSGTMWLRRSRFPRRRATAKRSTSRTTPTSR